MPAPNAVLAARANRFELRCSMCNTPSKVPSVWSVYCDCGGLFDVRYLDPSETSWQTPLAYPANLLNLGQGNTPAVSLDRTAKSLGLAGIVAKLEYCAPTGSFKDRGSAMLVSAAVEEGITEIVEDSSGNAGASVAAYSAAAGIKAHIFAPSSAAQGKLDQIRIFGAELHLIEGPRQAATDAAQEFATSNRLLHLSHALSPWFAEGVKALAHEIQALENVGVTDVVAPAGNGALLVGIAAGYSGGRSPRIHCVQSEGVQPLVAAFNDVDWDPTEARATAASGISVASPPRAAQAVQAVKSTNGKAVAVADDAMFEWQRWLAKEEGIFCEVTSAAAFAGLETLISNGSIESDAVVVVPVTGSGLKEPLRI